ncbi:MAG: TetR/AcrR family transcriptional regulator [Acutalibacteraceae bacterium]
MPQMTKKAIIECTFELAEKKPLNKITVRNIVDRCGITRNTFYYYFHDIYEVISVGISEILTQIKNNGSQGGDRILLEIIGFCIEHKKLWKNIYRSLGHDETARYVIGHLHTILRDYILSEADGIEISETDMNLILTFYEEALFGSMVRWLHNDKENLTPEELKLSLERMHILLDGNIQLIIKNSQKK